MTVCYIRLFAVNNHCYVMLVNRPDYGPVSNAFVQARCVVLSKRLKSLEKEKNIELAKRDEKIAE